MKNERRVDIKQSLPGISIIVLTWNGIRLIQECFPQIVAATQQINIPYEIILVDNGSADNTLSYVSKMWPDIHIIALEKNRGYSKANNYAAHCARYDTLLFVNNDLVFDNGFIESLIHRLEDPAVFAVAPKILKWDRRTVDDGLRYGEYHSGLFSVHLEVDKDKIDLPHLITFFCGACFVCRKERFFELGGFDEMYTPYAWEDLDLAYRAWKRGYTIVYEPQAVCYHKREATTRSLFSDFFFISLVWRNTFFFIWKNITYAPFCLDHIVRLPWKLLKFLFNGRWRYVCGFFRAVPYLPLIYWKRRIEKKKEMINDKDVLARSFQIINN